MINNIPLWYRSIRSQIQCLIRWPTLIWELNKWQVSFSWTSQSTRQVWSSSSKVCIELINYPSICRWFHLKDELPSSSCIWFDMRIWDFCSNQWTLVSVDILNVKLYTVKAFVVVWMGSEYIDILRQSTIIQTALWPFWIMCNLIMKSMVIFFHFDFGISGWFRSSLGH